jgi:hypothetical protein
VVLQFPPGSSLPPVDAALGAGASAGSLPAWGSAAALSELRRVLELAAAAPAPFAGQAERPDSNHLHVSAPGDGWLVVSERLGLFRGWRASLEGADVPIVRANGVLGALAVPPGARVELSYRPPGFVAGLLVLLAGVGLAVAAELVLRRRRRGRGAAGGLDAAPAQTPAAAARKPSLKRRPLATAPPRALLLTRRDAGDVGGLVRRVDDEFGTCLQDEIDGSEVQAQPSHQC